MLVVGDFRLSVPPADDINVIGDRLRNGVAYLHQELEALGPCVQFFFRFTNEGFFEGLVLFDVTSGKAPQTGIGLLCWLRRARSIPFGPKKWR